MASIEITVGRLLCGKVRRFLDKCIFKGSDIAYIESSGFIQRDFTVKGSDADIIMVRDSLNEFFNNHSK